MQYARQQLRKLGKLCCLGGAVTKPVYGYVFVFTISWSLVTYRHLVRGGCSKSQPIPFPAHPKQKRWFEATISDPSSPFWRHACTIFLGRPKWPTKNISPLQTFSQVTNIFKMFRYTYQTFLVMTLLQPAVNLWSCTVTSIHRVSSIQAPRTPRAARRFRIFR